MVSRAGTYVQIVALAYKVLKKLWDIWSESALREREDISQHLQAIYDVLRNVAARGSESPNLPPMLMLPPPEVVAQDSNVTNKDRKQFIARARRFRQDLRLFARTIGRYQSSFTVEDSKAIIERLNEIRKILSAIERRTRN